MPGNKTHTEQVAEGRLNAVAPKYETGDVELCRPASTTYEAKTLRTVRRSICFSYRGPLMIRFT